MLLRLLAAASASVALLLAAPETASAGPETDLVAAATNVPFVVYGTQGVSGDVVSALVHGVTCGSTVVDATQRWLLLISPDAPCAPRPGDVVTFEVNGIAALESEVWTAGYPPHNVKQGVTLSTVSGALAVQATAPAAPMSGERLAGHQTAAPAGRPADLTAAPESAEVSTVGGEVSPVPVAGEISPVTPRVGQTVSVAGNPEVAVGARPANVYTLPVPEGLIAGLTSLLLSLVGIGCWYQSRRRLTTAYAV